MFAATILCVFVWHIMALVSSFFTSVGLQSIVMSTSVCWNAVISCHVSLWHIVSLVTSLCCSLQLARWNVNLLRNVPYFSFCVPCLSLGLPGMQNVFEVLTHFSLPSASTLIKFHFSKLRKLACHCRMTVWLLTPDLYDGVYFVRYLRFLCPCSRR